MLAAVVAHDMSDVAIALGGVGSSDTIGLDVGVI